MVALFHGGPHDGLSYTNEQINKVAQILPTFSESGHRNFLLMPSPTDCTRIIRGETMPDGGTAHPYEMLRKPDGTMECHDAAGAIGNVLQGKNAPLTEEQQELKKTNAATADKFIEQLRAAAITADTEVSLIQMWRDRQGVTFREGPISIAGKPSVKGLDPEKTKKWEDTLAFDTAIQNINSLVRHAPTDFINCPGHPSNVLQIYDFELLIGKA
jgi:hypothetical protein